MAKGFIPPTPPRVPAGPPAQLPRRRRRGGKRVLIAVVALVLAIAAAGGVTLYLIHIDRRSPVGGNGSAAITPAATTSAALADGSAMSATASPATRASTRPATVPIWTLARPAPAPDAPPADDIQRALDNFAHGIAGRKGFLVDTSFDGERLVREIQALGFLSDVTDAKRPAMGEMLVHQLAKTFVDNPEMKFRGIDVRSVQPLPDRDEAIASVRVLAGNGRANYRFWVRRGPNSWKIFDFENVDGGPRSSQAIAAAVAASASAFSAPAWAAYVPRLSVIHSLMARKEYATARTEIFKLDNAGFPPQYEAMRLITKGMLYASAGNPGNALLLYDKAGKVRSDLPCLYLRRAACYNASGQPEKALASARLHLDQFGDDAKAYAEIGLAYERMGYPEVAVQAYERGIADDPSNDDNQRALDRILNPPKPVEPEPQSEQPRPTTTTTTTSATTTATTTRSTTTQP